MHLVITILAAIAATAWWYAHAPQSKMRVDILCWMFWGASMMWLVDMIAAYAAQGTAIFTPDPVDMLHETYLGLSVVALGGIIWIAYLVIRDPRGVRAASPTRKKPAAQAQETTKEPDLDA